MKFEPKKSSSKAGKNLTFVCRKSNNLLDFLLGTYGSTATKIKKLLGSNSIFVNEILTKDLKRNLSEGDVVVIKYEGSKQQDNQINVIFEDDWIVVVDKPAGLLTVSDGSGSESLFQNLKKQMDGDIFICHRLDREVSGLLIFSKSKEVQELIEDQWSEFQKTYFARVEGEMNKQNEILTHYLKMDGPTIVRVVKTEAEGVKAITEYNVIKKDKRYSDLEVNLHTGKKNQIRAQLSHIGHPICGDKKFGSNSKLQGRIALHSWKLSFKHPKTTEIIQLISPIPF